MFKSLVAAFEKWRPGNRPIWKRRAREAQADVRVLEHQLEEERAAYSELAALGQEGASDLLRQREVSWLEIDHLRSVILRAAPHYCTCTDPEQAFSPDCTVHRIEEDLLGEVDEGRILERSPLRSPHL